MKAHHGYGHEKVSTAGPRSAGTPARRQRSDGSRWGLWLTPLLVAAAAVLGVMLTGASGATTGVPAQIQVGLQAVSHTVIVPTKGNHGSTTTGVTNQSTTTIPTIKVTTVVQPFAKVTDHEGSSGRDNSSAGD
jgi:hypothetical protein